ncbi:hypothetical protein DSM104299_00178 [Baekduia alba]|uniref:hypothetical protein n=1 Tax=Baekduia alba TaxID=2997333 RepID=UPI00233FF498|nr:hypothetical protein [Baekduia alba]WCB91507.1 hypothetical protein DSM104299_00178 [Baekduia alba]
MSRPRGRFTASEIIDAIQRWHARYGEPPSMADWDPYRARQIGQEWRIARYRDGDWPSAKSVRNHFGRLSDAVAQAGLVPRRQGQRRAQAGHALDEGVLLHLAHLRAQQEARPAPESLALAVRKVAAARASREGDDLRASLVDLAAAALVWAKATSPADRAG